MAGVEPLHLLLMAFLLDRALAWADRSRPVDLALCGLLTGLALGNQLLTLLVAPFLGLFGLWAGRRAIAQQPMLLFLPIATMVLALAVYAYIPLAARLDPPLAYNHPTTPAALVALVTGAGARTTGAGIPAIGSVDATVGAMPRLVGVALARGAALLPVAGIAGLGVLLVRRPSLALALIGILIAGAHAWANDGQAETDLMVVFLVLGLGAAVAVEALARAGSERLPGLAGRVAGPAMAVAGVAMALAVTTAALPAADRSGDHAGDDYAAAMTRALPQDAALFSFWSASTPLWHAQLVLRERPDVEVVDATDIAFDPGGGTREERMAALVCQRPVLVAAPDESDLAPVRQRFTLNAAFSVMAGADASSGTAPLTVYRVAAPADTCG